MNILIFIIIARVIYQIVKMPLAGNAPVQADPPVINRIADPAAYAVRREFEERI